MPTPRPVAEELGRVNVVVNNAGVALHGDFEEMSYDDFEWVMDVDFWGVVQGTKEFLPHLIASGDGHVVNISSLFGLVGMPGQTAYNAAKFGVRGFTEALRQEMILAGPAVQGDLCAPRRHQDRHRPQRPRDRLPRARPRRRALRHQAGEADAGAGGRDHPRRGAGEQAAGPRRLRRQALDWVQRLLGARYQRLFTLAARRLGP